MDLLKTVVALCLVFTTVKGRLDIDRTLSLLNECKKETGATEDPVKILNREELPKTIKGKCMIACAMEKYGTIKDGKIYHPGMINFVDQYFKDEPDKYKEVLDGYTICELKVREIEDKCELATAQLACALAAGVHLS